MAGPASEPVHDPAKAALAWMHTARFLVTATQLDELPQTELPEIAFVGRSNAGKSSAINILAQQRQLAFASGTPGRTQHINYFELGPRQAPDALLVDLPGYGYAAVARDAKLRWQRVMADYLKWRRNLTAIVVLVDSRHGFTEIDRRLLAFVAPRLRGAGSCRLLVLLTKIDKLKRADRARALFEAEGVLADLTARSVPGDPEGAHADDSGSASESDGDADVSLSPFSTVDRTGVEDIAMLLHGWTRAPAPAAAAAPAPAPEVA